MIRVYVSGPIGANDDGRRARLDAALAAGAQLLERGFAPFVPHLWAAACNADDLFSYERWMAYDLAWLRTCDALLRIEGESPGADREVVFALEHGLPVFFSVDEIDAWRETQAADRAAAVAVGIAATRRTGVRS